MTKPSKQADAPTRPIRMVLAKPGLDGHDRGARVIARLFRDEGFEVIYSGLRQSPVAIVRTAIDEDADLIGLSILSGAHLALAARVLSELRNAGAGDIAVVVGGTVPRVDAKLLEEMGVAAVFGIGSGLDDVRRWIKEFRT